MVRLVPLEQKDLPLLCSWRNSDWLRPFVHEYRLLNMVNQRDWLDHISRSREVEMFGIEIEVLSGDAMHQAVRKVSVWELVGVCGLCNINWVNRTAEVAIYVALDYQHQGVASMVLGLLRQKAFEEFNLRRLWAEIYEFNTASLSLFQKCGYEIEGRMHKHVFKQGRFHDSLIYGLLKEEMPQ